MRVKRGQDRRGRGLAGMIGSMLLMMAAILFFTLFSVQFGERTTAGDQETLKNGHVCENSLMQYKLPTRLDIGRVQVELECSYEPTGPFGAKSIGEIVINTPSPAIANAVYNAVGVRIRELPITAEKIFNGLNQ